MSPRRDSLDSHSRPRQSRTHLLLGAAWAACLISACGGELYEQRLQNTRKFFAHLELLNANLHPDWSDGEAGIKLRVPRQFLVMPPPEKPEVSETSKSDSDGFAAEEQEAPVVVDDRQPRFLTNDDNEPVELPGLRGAFYAQVKIIGANGAAGTATSYIYVLSNHHLYDDADKAQRFNTDLVSLVSETLHGGVTAESWHEEKFPPRPGSFAQTVRYKAVDFTPPDPIEGVEMQMQALTFEQGNVQVTVLFVVPRDIDSAEKMTERIPLCLETLRVAGDKVTAPTSSGNTPGDRKPATF
ncbi:MAG: hypothetical protein ACKV0T_03285 [Planctomycetales bacterium]